ncbi:MAG: hypothetical protein HFE48_04475 [Clostridia bacterium]|nr:hypothetical protein [Clostridia bacterium]
MGKSVLVCEFGDSAHIGEIKTAFENAGLILLDEGEDEKATLDTADFLVLAACDAKDLENKNAEDKWQYFLDEIKWKRKSGGEVIIIDTSEISFSPSRLSYALKKCKRYRIGGLDDAVKYMKGGNESAVESQSVRPEPVKPPQQREEKKESGACRDDHVFGDDRGYKNYVRDDGGEKCTDNHVFEKEDEEADMSDWADEALENAKKDYERVSAEPFSEYPDIPRENRKTKKPISIMAIVVIVVVMIMLITMVNMCNAFLEMNATAGFFVGNFEAAESAAVNINAPQLFVLI